MTPVSATGAAKKLVPKNLLGDAIYTARRSRRLTQRDLAHKLGTAQTAVSQWELGETVNIAPQRLFEIEAALDLEPGTLSRLCGYVPLAAISGVTTTTAAIQDDPDLLDRHKEAMLVFYNDLKLSSHG